jgi:hypothetical protein
MPLFTEKVTISKPVWLHIRGVYVDCCNTVESSKKGIPVLLGVRQ